MIDVPYNEFIWGDKFKALSRCTFVKIDDAFDLVKNAKGNLGTIVSHNGDYPVDGKFLRFLDKFNRWFGQNMAVNHEKFIPIPIGLENDYVPNSIEKKRLLSEYMAKDICASNLLYVNHNIGTNPNERTRPYEMFSGKSFATVHPCVGFGGQSDYYRNIKEHFFVLSPPGNGHDCHRTWEILYLGRVPIVKKVGRLQDLYSDLPVVFIDDYDQISEQFLVDRTKEMSSRTFNFKKLTFTYWKMLIEG
jgi:hypothetical protein